MTLLLVVVGVGLVSGPALARGQAAGGRSRSEVRGEGRGFSYGAHLIAPVMLTDVRRAAGGAAAPVQNPGGGLMARVGWELPYGFGVEVQGGFAFHYVDRAPDTLSRTLTRVDVRGALRYSVFNDSIVVPFFEAGVGLRLLTVEYGDGVDEPAPGATVAAHGGAGVRFELSPYFDLEVGLDVDYAFAMGGLLDEPGMVSLTPFAGVTLYLFDESES